MNLATGDLSGLDPRADLERLLAAAATLEDPAPLLAALAEAHPVAFAEVACGARSPGGPRLVRAALVSLAPLERALSPRGCYPRLVELAGDPAVAAEVLRLAATRHPAGSWLVALSRRVEGGEAGATHLVAAADHPSFAAMCRAHADAGHVEGLVLAAGRTGRPEPVAALLPLGVDPALRAAGAALDHTPACPVVPWLAAVWGPEPDALVARIVPHLRSRAAAEALLAASRHLPRSRAMLTAVIRGLA